MHDPMVLAWEVVVPFPKRVAWRERSGTKRWGITVDRCTNAENLGERVYPWWRLKGRHLWIGGRCYGMRRVADIWHVDPSGHDAFDRCPRTSRWKWHVNHWEITWFFNRSLKRSLLERCELCGRRYPWNYAPIAHQWDTPATRWRDGIVRRSYHHECSNLVQARITIGTDERLIRNLFAGFRTVSDLGEEELLARMTDPKARGLDFGDAYRLTRLLGYERDDDYRLVKKP